MVVKRQKRSGRPSTSSDLCHPIPNNAVLLDIPGGAELSLNDGRGAMALSRKPVMGTSPSTEGCMQMVPPVMMMSTRDSG
jgi:hypothetical protein